VAELTGIIISMLPALVRMSIGFVRVTTAILKFIGVIGSLLSWLNLSAESIGIVIASTLTLISAWLILTGLAKLVSISFISSAFSASAWATTIARATGIVGAFNTVLAYTAVLFSILTFGAAIAGMITFMDRIKSTRKEMEKLNSSVSNFDRLSGNMGGAVGGLSGGGSVTYNVEGSDDPESDGKYLSWREYRTSGDRA